MIQESKNFGADLVKFQRDLDLVYSKEVLDQKEVRGNTNRDPKKGLEFGKKEYDEIDNFCKKIKIKWFASAWDLKSLDFLKNYNLEYNKIASAMIVDLKLLEEVAKEKIYFYKHRYVYYGKY